MSRILNSILMKLTNNKHKGIITIKETRKSLPSPIGQIYIKADFDY